MDSFDDGQLGAALVAVTLMEREVRRYLDTGPGPAEAARGWTMYRSAVGLRKALVAWAEMRQWRATHARECESGDAATA